MSSLTGKVYVCVRGISHIRILDLETLEEIDRIPIEADDLRRLVSFDSCNSETSLFVVSGANPKSCVSLFDFETKGCLGQINDVTGSLGLESLSSFSLSSNPIIVCGGFGGKICAYDFFSENENKCLVEFENPPTTRRICCFAEWSSNEVFVGGMGKRRKGALYRYDVNQGGFRLGSYVGHVGGYCTHVYGITASLLDGVLISGSNDDLGRTGTLWLWSKDNCECITSVALDHSCSSLAYCTEFHLICCGTRDEIEIWDIRNMNRRIRKVVNVGNGPVHDMDQIPSLYSSSLLNDSLFVSGCGKFVSMWNPNTGKVLQKCDVDGDESYAFGLRVLPCHYGSQQVHLSDFGELTTFIVEQFGEWYGVCWIRIGEYSSSLLFRVWKSQLCVSF